MNVIKSLALILFVAASQATAEDVLKPVKLLKISSTPIGFERQFFGQVKARQSVDLAFQVGGQIVEFPVTEGLNISKGSTIAVLDQEPFELTLKQARLQKEQADRTVARLEKLSANTVSQVAIDDAQTQAGLAAIALRQAEWSLEHATLHAPFDALVSSRNVELFTTVGAGASVVRIHDLSELRIEVDVPEILFQRTGTEQDIRINARFPNGPTEYPLEIREFDAETSTIGQTFRVTFGMEPPKGQVILPGSSVTVSVHAQEPGTGIIVPPTALVPNEAGEIGVFRFEPTGSDKGTVTWVAAETIPSETGEIRVLSGLSDGDEIVLTGGGALMDGQSVRRFSGFGN